MDNVCNRRLFSFPCKVEMAKEQEYYEITMLCTRYWNALPVKTFGVKIADV